MAISNVSSNLRAGVCTFATRPQAPFTGQVIFEVDTKQTLVWQGSAWVMLTDADQPPGLQLIVSRTASAESSVSVDGCFTTEFQNYRIEWAGSLSTAVEMRLELRNSGSNKTNTEYIWQGIDRNGASTISSFGSDAKQSYLYFSNGSGADNLTFSSVDVFRPKDEFRTGFLWNTGFEWTSNTFYWRTGMGYFDLSDSCDGFRIYTSTGTLTGTIRVYGYRN